jgi:hypothetical protein
VIVGELVTSLGLFRARLRLIRRSIVRRCLLVTRRIPVHPALAFLRPYLGVVKKPETIEEALLESIESYLLCDGFPGFEGGACQVAMTLCEHGIDPVAPTGQQILGTYVEHALDDYYGDFYRYADCQGCGEEFRPTHSLAYANDVLAGVVYCPACRPDADDEAIFALIRERYPPDAVEEDPDREAVDEDRCDSCGRTAAEIRKETGDLDGEDLDVFADGRTICGDCQWEERRRSSDDEHDSLVVDARQANAYLARLLGEEQGDEEADRKGAEPAGVG